MVIGILFALAGAGLIVLAVKAPERSEPADLEAGEYLRSLEWGEDQVDEFEQLLSEPFITRVLRPVAGRLTGSASGILPRNIRDSIHQKLVLAGLTSHYRAEEIVTAQGLLAIAGFALALLLGAVGLVEANLGLLLLVVFPILGVQFPKSVINRKADDRQAAIRKDLPDTLDLLAISVEAGMGFEGALGIVSANFESPLADEFNRTLQEMQLGLPRRQALENLKRRTDVNELSGFVVSLTQADALGMPIGRVLKTQADEMRNKRRAWAREKAGKLPIKILFPLLPVLLATFIVILGPAVSSMREFL